MWSTLKGRSVRGQVGELVIRGALDWHDTRILAGRTALPGNLLVTV
jgi:hypothetical protein